MFKPQPFKLALAPSNKILANFSSQLLQQQQLLTLIKSVLPENLVEHACYCVISGKKILIYTDKAVWASQLRFYQTALFDAITGRDRYASVEQIQIRILSTTTGMLAPRSPKVPTLETTHAIRKAVQGDQEDPLLQAVNNLCCTLEKLDNK
jgi:hypothetical protein